MKTARPIKFLLLALILSTTKLDLLGQGSLLPPGAPAPGMKTLDQIQPWTPIAILPFVISNAGAYYLTANLSGGAGQNGIIIQASDVTLDLNGFTLSGASNSLSGIVIPSARTNILIRNGSVRSWGLNGIDAGNATLSRVEKVRSSANKSNGIAVGTACTVEHSVAWSNGGVGIQGGSRVSLLCNLARSNGSHGMLVGDDSAVNESTADMNSEVGIQGGSRVGFICDGAMNNLSGFLVGDGSTISGCAAELSTGVGIVCGSRVTILNTAARAGSSNGIVVLDDSTIKDCTVEGNANDGIQGRRMVSLACDAAFGNGGRGAFLGDFATVNGSMVYDNSSDGLQTGTNGLISCTDFSGNQGRGAVLGDYASVKESTFENNTGDGLQTGVKGYVACDRFKANGGRGALVGDGSQVRDCIARDNSSQGVEAGNLCGIQCNEFISNGLKTSGDGLHLTGSGGQVTQNRATGNGGQNYNIAQGNDLAPIGSAATATSPFANLQF